VGCYAKAENEEVVGYLFIMPALLVLGTFFVLLILYSIFLSLSEGSASGQYSISICWLEKL
jgi:ABC-type sugar transport system permease subunit